MSPSKLLCLFSVIVIINPISVLGKCDKSFIATCDNLSDVEYNKTKNTWTELLVQYPPYEELPPKYTLSSKHLDRDVSNLKWLIINGQLISIHRTAFTYTRSLEYVLLYKNKLRIILPSAFKKFKNLQKLGLNNNLIQDIKQGAFVNTIIDIIDLSHNKLATLKANIFINNCKITRLIITNNELRFIENGSLPTSLKILNLDNNYFRFIPDDLKNLNGLTEFSISYNQIVNVDGTEWSMPSSLRRLDLSFNTISFVDGGFDRLDNLVFLNLAKNLLERFNFTPSLQTHLVGKQFVLLLAHNHLRNLVLPAVYLTDGNPDEDPAEIMLTLSGNPWNCHCIKRIEQQISNGSQISRTGCDRKIFSSGNTPFCVVSKVKDCQNDVLPHEIDDYMKKAETAECNVFNNINADTY